MTATIPETTTATKQRVVFDLSSILNYPIKLAVERWHADRPLHWFSYNDEDILAEGSFLGAPGLPLFILEDNHGKLLFEDIPEGINSPYPPDASHQL